MLRASERLMPSTFSRSAMLARLTPLADPKAWSNAFLRSGPMPATSSSGLRRHPLGAPRPVDADGEAVRLVAQPLDEIEHRLARLEHEGRPGRADRNAPARHRGPAPWRRRHAEGRRARARPARRCGRRAGPAPPSISTRSGQHRRLGGPRLGILLRAGSRAPCSLRSRAKRRSAPRASCRSRRPGVRSVERMLNLRYWFS